MSRGPELTSLAGRVIAVAGAAGNLGPTVVERLVRRDAGHRCSRPGT